MKETFNRLFEASIKKFWDSPAFTDYHKATLKYSEVGKKILFLHAFYKTQDVEPGDKIALIGSNSANWAIVYLATLSYGAVIVPILSDFHDEDIRHIIIHSESRILFATEAIVARIAKERIDVLKAIISLDSWEFISYQKQIHQRELRKLEKEYEDRLSRVTRETFNLPPDRNESELAALVYTSGTSGFSKGAMLPFRSLVTNTVFARDNLRLDMAEQTLSFLPLAHSYASAFDLLFPFTVGCHITFLGQMPSPKILIQAFSEIKPSLILFVPMIIEKLYKKNLAPLLSRRAIRFLLKIPLASQMITNKIKRRLADTFGGNFKEIIIGGAALNAEVENFFKRIKLPITVGYGMTECGPLISYSPWYEHRAQTVGRAITPVHLKIDSNDQSKQVGEIMVRGDNVMLGYYKNSKATREVLTSDGWLRTGDLGIVDSDGFVYIRGRCKNMILGPSGQNIYPEEIESKLNVIPYIQESLVMSNNNRLVALVYPDWDMLDFKAEWHKGDKQSQFKKKIEDIRKEINSRLPLYCRLAEIRLHAESFEKTPTQKIKRYRYSGQ